ncbi:MAG: hypothetical protein KKF41_16875 [Actinobacteria bacterium]|nr:hypothetical protein [Actinomycetota bacterium]MBU1944705.1 hypothetical protein [Actinomycetota bacterium]MBU2689253.1 hypothetical protein [Actinomycetota bacterium]
MPIICPTCGAENPEHAAFCNLCCSSVGFDSPEYTSAPQQADGFSDSYPSSFDPNAQHLPPDGFTRMPDAGAVDIGQYGVRSGQQAPDYSPVAAAPVDIGQYGVRSGYPVTPSGYQGQQDDARVSRFQWRRAVWQCLGIALLTAIASCALEVLMGFMGVAFALGGNTVAAYVIIFAVLLVPITIGTFVSGYRLQENGWAVGLITVGFWALVFRPLYFAILAWLLSGRFTFIEVFNTYTLVFIFAVWFPLGALMGWLGEKRATTGLHF